MLPELLCGIVWCNDVPLHDVQQLSFLDVVLAETVTIADAVLTCLETNLDLVSDVDDTTDVLMSDATSFHHLQLS